MSLIPVGREARDHREIDDRADRRDWHSRHAPPHLGPGRGRRRRRGVLRRTTDDRLVGGVAGALARRTGIDVTIVRVAVLLFGLSGGFGAAAYVLAWLFIPLEGEDVSIASRALADRRTVAVGVAALPLVVVVVVFSSLVGDGWLNSFGWVLLIVAVGLAIIWRDASDTEQVILRRMARPATDLLKPGLRTRRALWLRVALAAVVFVTGVLTLAGRNPRTSVIRPLGGLLLVIGAVVVVFGPWWLRIARDLGAERQARARAEERAELAARVHDSVLQTLALIQRNADQPAQVTQLARAQERELRSWLFDGKPPGSANVDDTTFAAGVKRIQDEVESTHGVTVEAVVVGECPLDDSLRGLLAAGKEATVNAAKWSGSPVVSLFAEVEPASVSMFVRDRGKGFSPDEVAEDRKGIAESVRGRMARLGGSAVVRSTPGSGTEVELRLPVGNQGRRAPSSRP